MKWLVSVKKKPKKTCHPVFVVRLVGSSERDSHTCIAIRSGSVTVNVGESVGLVGHQLLNEVDVVVPETLLVIRSYIESRGGIVNESKDSSDFLIGKIRPDVVLGCLDGDIERGGASLVIVA